MAAIPGARIDITGASGSQGLLSPKGSWTCYIFPRGANAAQDSSAALITFDTSDEASRFAANDWIQAGIDTANIRQVSAVGGNSISISGDNLTISENDRIFVIGSTEPTVAAGVATYLHPNTAIYERGDDQSDLITNSAVTSNSDGLIQFWSRQTPSGLTYYDCMIQDGDGTNQGSIIDMTVGTGNDLSQTFNVVDFGALGDGTTDDSGAIQSAFDAASVGARIYFPVGTYFYASGSSTTIPSGVVIYGEGKNSILSKGAADTADVFFGDAATDVIIRDLAFAKSAANSANDGAAIALYGACTDVVIENVIVDQFANGIDVEGAEGTTASTAERISCRRVQVKNTNAPTAGLYGFNFGDATDISMEDCVASGMWLDGAKLRRKTYGARLTNCILNSNGASGAGDGIDMFAGGDEACLMNVTANDNTGNGINIKTGDLNRSANFATYGICRNVLISGCRGISNTSHGFIINRSSAAATDDPLPAHVVLSGCYAGENGAQGFYIRGRNTVMQGCVSRLNQANGLDIQIEALDVRIDGCMFIANSQAAAGSGYGMSIAGQRVSVDNCLFNGADDDIINEDGDYSGVTQYQQRPINVTDDSSVVIIGANNVYTNHSVDDSVSIDSTATSQVVVDGVGTLDMVSSGVAAGPGSIQRRWNGAGNPMLFLKLTGYTATGWTPLEHAGVSPDALDDTGTPSIAQNWFFKTGGTTAITDFDDGLRGKTIKVLSGHTITITNSATIVLSGNTDFIMSNGDTLTLSMFNDQIWHETARSDNT